MQLPHENLESFVCRLTCPTGKNLYPCAWLKYSDYLQSNRVRRGCTAAGAVTEEAKE